MAVLAGEPVASALEVARQHQSTADAGAEGDEHHVGDALRRPEHPLGDRRARGVVVDPDPMADLGAEQSGDVDVGDTVEVRCGTQHAAARHEAGDADAECVVGAERIGEFGQGVDQARDRAVATRGGSTFLGDDVTVRVERDPEALGAADVDADRDAGRHAWTLRPRRRSSAL
ncbi:MAG: hypothetical protein R2697_20755 [Ilumatobacteraceae bacterium]